MSISPYCTVQYTPSMQYTAISSATYTTYIYASSRVPSGYLTSKSPSMPLENVDHFRRRSMEKLQKAIDEEMSIGEF